MAASGNPPDRFENRPFDARLVPLPEGEQEAPETVWALTRRVAAMIGMEFSRVRVLGEISNFKRHASGHVFFTLKDDRASLRCVVWRSTASRLPAEAADGLEVEARGHLGVFEKTGHYQLYVSRLIPRGTGPLEVAFRRQKERLAAEGLFDPERKRPLPRFPRRIGLVTSPSGAAVQDILHVLARRWPVAAVVLAPARVQGDGAAAEIARGIRNLNRTGRLDVLIIARGGGSLEDLWPFNEEVVARAVRASATPVVSAVGHETDFSISDFAADLRAPTPSAAAELVVPDRREVEANIQRALRRMARALMHVMERQRDQLALLRQRRFLKYPHEIVLQRVQTIQRAEVRAAAAMQERQTAWRLRVERAAGRLSHNAPSARWQRGDAAVRLAAFRLAAAANLQVRHRRRARLDGLAARLEDLHPDRVLSRGYSRTVLERTGKTLARSADARPGDRLRTVLAEGDLVSRVEDVASQRPSSGSPPEGEPDSVNRT